MWYVSKCFQLFGRRVAYHLPEISAGPCAPKSQAPWRCNRRFSQAVPCQVAPFENVGMNVSCVQARLTKTVHMGHRVFPISWKKTTTTERERERDPMFGRFSNFQKTVRRNLFQAWPPSSWMSGANKIPPGSHLGRKLAGSGRPCCFNQLVISYIGNIENRPGFWQNLGTLRVPGTPFPRFTGKLQVKRRAVPPMQKRSDFENEDDWIMRW